MSGFSFWGRKATLKHDFDQTEETMADLKQTPTTPTKAPLLTLDGWAVAIALLLVALVRLGVLKHVAW